MEQTKETQENKKENDSRLTLYLGVEAKKEYLEYCKKQERSPSQELKLMLKEKGIIKSIETEKRETTKESSNQLREGVTKDNMQKIITLLKSRPNTEAQRNDIIKLIPKKEYRKRAIDKLIKNGNIAITEQAEKSEQDKLMLVKEL